MGKFSSYPPDTLPTIDDYVLSVDAGSTSNRRVLLADLITLFFNNQPATAATSTTLAQDTQFDFVKGGTGVITADSAGVNRNASMSAVTAYQNGQKLTIAAVSARGYTASKDTYVDILNTAGVGSLVYTEVTNNAASPALAANSIRLGIIVTGATTITAAASINQGQKRSILPIASSINYSVSDSLGNLICPRDPNRKVLSYREILATSATQSTSVTQAVGLTAPAIVPTGRKVKISIVGGFATMGSAAKNLYFEIWRGTVGSGTKISGNQHTQATAGYANTEHLEGFDDEVSGLQTYNYGFFTDAGPVTITLQASSNSPMGILVELD